MKLRKILNSLLVLVFMSALLWAAVLVIEKSDRGITQQAVITSHSTGTESITIYDFGNGALTGRVGALGVSAAEGGRKGLEARFNAVLVNGLERPLKIRDMRAVTRSAAARLRNFDFSFEKAQVTPGQEYAFAGTAAVDAEFFNEVVRSYDLALRVETDLGALEFPLQIYTLDVESAMKTGLLKTDQVRFGDAVGTINFLNCEQASAEDVCEPMLKQMQAGGF